MFYINGTVTKCLLPVLLLATVFRSIVVEGREEDGSSTKLPAGPYTHTAPTRLPTKPEITTDKLPTSDLISVTLEFKELASEPNSTIRSSINRTFIDLFGSEKEKIQIPETKLEVSNITDSSYLDYGLEEAKQELIFDEVALVKSSLSALHSNRTKTIQNKTEADYENQDLIETEYAIYDNVKSTTDKSEELNNSADENRDINSTEQEIKNSNGILVSQAPNENLDISTVKPIGAAITVIQNETQNTYSNSSESQFPSTFNIDMTTVSSHSNKSSPSREVTKATEIQIAVQHKFNKSPESVNISTDQPEVAIMTSLSNKSSTEAKSTGATIATQNNFSKPTEPVQIYSTEVDVERNTSNTYYSTETVVDEEDSIITPSEPVKSSVTNVEISSTEVEATTELLSPSTATNGINTLSETFYLPTTHRTSTTNEAVTTTSITTTVRPLNIPNSAEESSKNKDTKSPRDESRTKQNNLQTYSPQYMCIRPGRFPARPSCTEYHVCHRAGVWLFHFKERCNYGLEFSSSHRSCVPPHVSDCRKEFVFSYIHNQHNKEDESKSSESVNENSDEDSNEDSRSSHSEEEPRTNILTFLLKKKVKYE